MPTWQRLYHGVNVYMQLLPSLRGRRPVTEGKSGPIAESRDDVQSIKLSIVDKQILKFLLEPGAEVSSRMLEQKLGIPRSTIQRRRRHLEQTYLEHPYFLNLANLGYRRVDLLI